MVVLSGLWSESDVPIGLLNVKPTVCDRDVVVRVKVEANREQCVDRRREVRARPLALPAGNIVRSSSINRQVLYVNT